MYYEKYMMGQIKTFLLLIELHLVILENTMGET